MRARRALFAAALVSVQPAYQNAFAADRSWLLFGRHGGCSPIRDVLERKFPDIGNVADPESFIRFVRAKGLAVSSKVVPGQAGAAVAVDVPEKGLALVFATAELCSRAPDTRR